MNFLTEHVSGVAVRAYVPIAGVAVELATFKPKILFVCCLVRFVVDIVHEDSGNYIISKELVVRRFRVKCDLRLLEDAVDVASE